MVPQQAANVRLKGCDFAQMFAPVVAEIGGLNFSSGAIWRIGTGKSCELE
jgi:hypothetical protein